MSNEIDYSEKNLKTFGRIMCLCLLTIGSILFLKHRQGCIILWPLGLTFLFFAQVVPHILRPIYKFWMFLASWLGWFNTRLILLFVYYLVLTPIGLLAKLFRKDFLNLKLEKEVESYWIKKEQASYAKERYEKIF